MSTPPFTDAKIPEVCGRVALALVIRQWRNEPDIQLGPSHFIRRAYTSLPVQGFDIVKTALLGLEFHIARQGGTSTSWRRTMLANSRYGAGFRLCYFNDYKATRRR